MPGDLHWIPTTPVEVVNSLLFTKAKLIRDELRGGMIIVNHGGVEYKLDDKCVYGLLELVGKIPTEIRSNDEIRESQWEDRE